MTVNGKNAFVQLALLAGLIVNAQTADIALESAPEPSLVLNDFKVYGTKVFNLSLYQKLSTAFKNSAYYRVLGWADSNTLILLVNDKETMGDIFTFNLTTGRLKKITSINKQIERAAAAPNGKRVALITLHQNRRTLGVLNLESGDFTEYPINHRRLSRQLIWDADSTKVGFYSVAKILSYPQGDKPQKERRKKTLHIYDVPEQRYQAFDKVDNEIHFTSFCQSEPCVYVEYRTANGKYRFKRFYYQSGEYLAPSWKQAATDTVEYLIPVGPRNSFAYAIRGQNGPYALAIEEEGKRTVYCNAVSGEFVFFNYNKDANWLTAIVDNKGQSSIIYMDLKRRQCHSMSDTNWSQYGSVFPAPDGKRIAYNVSGQGYRNNIYTLDVRSGQSQLIKQSEVLGEKVDTNIVTKAFTYPTFDKDESGKTRQIPAYWIENKTATSNPKVKKPVFVLFHGGPPSQYIPRFTASTYATIKRYNAIVVAPNIRGSSGYGAAYMNMDNKEKRIDSNKDADYLVKYLLKQEVVDTTKIFLAGISYGTVPAYWAAFHNQQHIAGVIDYAGVKDMTFAYELEHYDTSRLYQTEYGDRHDPKLRAVVKQVSPYYYAAGLKMPIFMFHNERDKQVPVSNSYQFYRRVSQHNDDVLLLSDTASGHSFHVKESLYKYYAFYFDWLDKKLLANTIYNKKKVNE